MARVSSIVCIGGAHWDLIARADAPLCPGGDAPGRIHRQPGGVAANIALALARHRLAPILIAAIGDDTPGHDLRDRLDAAGVDCRYLARHAGASDRYLAIEDADGTLHSAVADCRALERGGTDLIAPLTRGPLADFAGTVLLDGNLPPATLTALGDCSVARRSTLVLVPASPAKAPRFAGLLGLGNATIYANRAEAEALCRAALPDSASAAAALVAFGAVAALVTDGADAATWADRTARITRIPPAIDLQTATGAGDVLVAAHLAARSHGAPAAEALDAALAAAASHAAGIPA